MKRNQVDALLVQHGQDLFWPRAQRGPEGGELHLPKRCGQASSAKANGGGAVTASAVRQRVRLVVNGAPPVIVKITGGATGMSKVRQHLRYMTERGEVLRDDQGHEYRDRAEVRIFGDHFQVEGSLILTEGTRREALHLALDMPPGTDPEAVQAAAVEFAQEEFAGHRWAWVYHGHQGHPHVHMIVRVEGRDLTRLNPRKADLYRWRERFALALQTQGVPAQATSRLTRGSLRLDEPAWVRRARTDGTLRRESPLKDAVTHRHDSMKRVLTAWAHIHAALADSPDVADRALAAEVKAFVRHMPMVSHVVGVELDHQRQLEKQHQQPGVQVPQQGQEREIGW